MEAALKVSELEQKIASLEAVILRQSEQIDKLTALNKFYEEQFKLSQRQRFGQSSEQTPDQISFENMFNEIESQADSSLPEPTIEEITYKRKKRTGKRKEDLSGLPTERIEYELPESERICPVHGTVMEDIGVTVRDELEIIPAKVIHKEHAVHAYGCKTCREEESRATVIRAEAPQPLISGSLASPSAVAHIASQKYVNGIPLYRSEKGLSYDGVILSRQTMANWLIYCAQNYLKAFYSLLITYLLMETVIHADETTLKVLKEPGREAKTDSYEWVYRTMERAKHQIVIFDYKETRAQEHPVKFLGGFKGYLCTDGYKVYHGLPPDIVVVGCWAHCRRYWEKTYEALPKDKREGTDAELGLVYCNLMFWLEQEYRDLEPGERLEKRLEFSKRVSDDFFEWAESLKALPEHLLGKAVTYTLSQRKYLENIYMDGNLEISNNAAERAIRPFVQGRKQWLFANTPDGAESSSMYYSLIETAKANNLNPYQYLKYLLEKLPLSKCSEMKELLPWSESLPDCCRVPQKESSNKPETPKYLSAKGPLHQALMKLRIKYWGEDSPIIVTQPVTEK